MNHQNKKLTLIEIGAGFNTPVWVRYPFEQIVHFFPEARLIRINIEYPEVPDEIKSKSISIRGKAMEAITEIWKELGLNSRITMEKEDNNEGNL